jgi:hypothetical protein
VTIPRPTFTPDELRDATRAWESVRARGNCPSAWRPAAEKLAHYMIARGYDHDEPADARPFLVHPDGAREGHAGVFAENRMGTVADVEQWLREASARPRPKGTGPMLSPGHTRVLDATGQRQEKHCASIGWGVFDCDDEGDWNELAAVLGAHGAATVWWRSANHCPKGCGKHRGGALKWHLLLPLRHVWIPSESFDAARARWKGELYPAMRFALHVAGGLLGKGFDAALDQMLARFYPGAPERDHAHAKREVAGVPGLGIDPEAMFAALEELGIVPAAAERRNARETAAAEREASLRSPEGEPPPMVQAFVAAGLYLHELPNGKHAVTCPWSEMHTPGRWAEDSTVLFADGKLHCSHSHPEGRGRDWWRAALDKLPPEGRAAWRRAVDAAREGAPAMVDDGTGEPGDDCLEGLAERVKADPGAHLAPNVVRAAATLRLRDEAEYERLRVSIKAAGGNVAAFAQQVGAAYKELRRAKALAEHEPDGDDEHAKDGRPRIVVTKEVEQVNDAAIAALAGDPSLFQRDHRIVRVIEDPARLHPQPPKIAPVTENTLRERLAAAAQWVSKGVDPESGAPVYFPEIPPMWAIGGVLDRQAWNGLRVLTNVTDCPILRPDGTVLEEPGYDEATGFLYVPRGEFPRVPEAPTREDVEAALAKLFQVFGEFEFDWIGPKDTPEGNKALQFSCALAALLTMVARPAIDGPVPGFFVSAFGSGTGKTLLVLLLTAIALGAPVAASKYTDDDEEFAKAILGHLLTGKRAVFIDNVREGTTFGGPSIDIVMSAWPRYEGRLLGSNNVPSVSNHATWFASGNNVKLATDTVRRWVRVRLRSTKENPALDEREFREQQPVKAALARRPELVVAALTLLRAWWVAGRPRAAVGAWDGFNDWAGIVPQVLVWLNLPSPHENRFDAFDDNEDRLRAERLLQGWAAVCEVNEGPTTTERALTLLRDPGRAEQLEALHEALAQLDPKRPPREQNPITLGRILGRCEGKNIGGRALVRRKGDGRAWEVRGLDAPPVGRMDGSPTAIRPPICPEETTAPQGFGASTDGWTDV